jgi:UDP-N-acetylglucosamine 4,6-dehydratase
MNLSDSSILITGGTGTFGQACVEELLTNYHPKRLVVYSRDESKQHTMAQRLGAHESASTLRFFIGDVRDRDRLKTALNGINIIIHAAALKQVPACEYNPIEAVKTNIGGATNVIEAAIEAKVDKVIALGTDKSVNPINLYGGTKFVAERLFVQANCLSTLSGTKFAVTRYGNVIGSRGSVIEVFKQQRQSGHITITDPRMTRFVLTVQEGVKFVLDSLERMQGGEVFVPEIPSVGILDIARAVVPDCVVDPIGIRPGEKLHETLISADESRWVLDCGSYYMIEPPFHFWRGEVTGVGTRVPEGFSYTSDTNERKLTSDELHTLVGVL